MSTYFLRYTMNASSDLERAYSFVGYQLFDTPEQAIEFHSEFCEVDEDDIAQDNVTGLWGLRRVGLCGFGPFDTQEEAESFDCDLYDGIDKHIFEGRLLDDTSLDDGICFYPVNVLK